MTETTPHSLLIRPAIAGDRDSMFRITRGVWNGTDYVPFLWQRWLEDRSGYLCVASWNGRVVGLQHTSVQADTTAWIEGIRVDESLRGRGIATAMLQHGLEWARAGGCSVARLSTSSGNQSSWRMAQKAGFRELERFDLLSGPTSAATTSSPGVRLAHAGDLPGLRETVLQEWKSDERSPLYTEGWTASRLTPERLALLVAVHAVVIFEVKGIEAVGIATTSVRRSNLRLGYLHGSIAGMTAIGAWMQGQARAASIEHIRATLSSGSAAGLALRSLGLSSDPAFSIMILFEQSL